MQTQTLEGVYQEIVKLAEKVEALKECFHEEFLPLTLATSNDIERSREQIRKGEVVRLNEL